MPFVSSHRVLILSLCAAIGIGVLSLAAPTQAAFPGANGRVVFQSDRTASNLDIWSVTSTGVDATSLHASGDVDAEPTWSPDGTKIAFRSGTGIYTMNPDGSAMTYLGTDGFNPTWSPDGSKIAFNGNADGDMDIFTINSNGSGGLAPVTSNTATDRNPSWSPNGLSIAYESDSDGNFEIWTRNADGSGTPSQVTTTTSPTTATQPDFSPTGQSIAYTIDDGADQGINISGLGGGVFQDSPTVDESDAAWSPDGSKIAYVDNFDGNTNIRKKSIAGGSAVSLVFHPANDSQPSWQPLYTVPKSTGSPATTAINVPLVPSFRQTISNSQCTARGGTPLTHLSPDIPGGSNPDISCKPPAFIPGTRAFFGIQAVGLATISVILGNPTSINVDEADYGVTMSLTDVRTGGALGADYAPNAGGPEVTMLFRMRITDTSNNIFTAADPATVEDLDFSVPVNCSTTAYTNIGATCGVSTTLDGLLPNVAKEQNNTVMDVFRIRARDSGNDTVRGNADDREFAMQGLYQP